MSTTFVIKKVLRTISHPSSILLKAMYYTRKIWPDEAYVKVVYRLKMGRKLNLSVPRSFTEKLQWLKLNNRRPEYCKLVDKVAVKTYVADKIGQQYIIPTLGVWERFEDIDFDALPNQFVLKTNHDGGGSNGVFIVKDKDKADFEKARHRLTLSMRRNLFWDFREWPYKNVKPCIFAEQYVDTESGQLDDYKFYCFNGEPKAMIVATNRFTSHNFTYFDMDFNPIDIICRAGKPDPNGVQKPACWEEMKKIASILSSGIPHVRVDLYCVSGKPKFGEMTFFDGSGYDDMNSDYWNNLFGDWIVLPAPSNK